MSFKFEPENKVRCSGKTVLGKRCKIVFRAGKMHTLDFKNYFCNYHFYVIPELGCCNNHERKY